MVELGPSQVRDTKNINARTAIDCVGSVLIILLPVGCWRHDPERDEHRSRGDVNEHTTFVFIPLSIIKPQHHTYKSWFYCLKLMSYGTGMQHVYKRELQGTDGICVATISLAS